MSFQIRIDGTDTVFACDEATPLIDAAARQGIELPYSCRKGVCGNCRGQVLDGRLVPGTEGGGPETGITQPDEHLFCLARPASHLVIRPREWRRIDPAARRTIEAKVFRITAAAPDVTVLHLRFPAGVRAKFRAGQYLQLVLPDGQRRSYSLANAPHESDGALLHVRHVAGGAFSGTLLPTLKPGDRLTVEVAHGDFWWREDTGRPLLLVAGGTGFAPMRAIVEHLIRRGEAVPVHLFWGVRGTSGHYAAEPVSRWPERLPGFQFHPVVSARTRGDEARPADDRGSLVEAVLASGLPIAAHDVYACGAPAMVSSLRQACIEAGLPPQHFHSDAFVAGA